jgi:hypothetical protein
MVVKYPNREENADMRACATLLIVMCAVAGAVAWACDPPGGGINGPPDGGTVSGKTDIQLTVTSETEVKGVDIYVDGNLLDSLDKDPYTYSWDTTKASNGSHEISAKVRAVDRPDGAIKPVKVTVEN